MQITHTMEKKGKKNFKTLWIRYQVKSSEKHQLFIKEHSVRNQASEHPKGRTVFVLNIPPVVSDVCLMNAFADAFGPVTSVSSASYSGDDDTLPGFKTGYVVFERELGLSKALSCDSNFIVTLSTSATPIISGVKKWCKMYKDSICGEDKIKNEIKEYMAVYDKQIEDKLECEKMLAECEDEEGWSTVTGRKKRGQFAVARKESTIEKIKFKEEERKHKKQLMNFYTFQIREAKKQNLVELRKKFELDKQKLEQIKSKRSFKPFR